MRRRRQDLIWLILFACQIAAGWASARDVPLPKTSSKAHESRAGLVDSLLQKLSPEEKIGQVLFLGLDGSRMDESTAAFLRAQRPGGVALYRHNIKSVRQTLRFVRGIHEQGAAGVPIFVSVDQEGGSVVRFENHATVLPSAMALGATFDPDLARRAGAALGRDLRWLGLNMNLAPVLDVLSNPRNSAIGIRSFGESPRHVAAMGVAFVEGMQSQGVSAVAKHFPGHGDVETDSHSTLPIVRHHLPRLLDVELLPFREAGAAGLDALMTAHIAVPYVAEEEDMPATVSRNVLTGLLRRWLEYDGVVITDGLEMAGIAGSYSSGEAAVRAILAGADMVMALWSPEKKEEVRQSLAEAVRSGRLPISRLDQSVRRILEAKRRRGLFDRDLLDEEDAVRGLMSGERTVVAEVARRAVTLVRNQGVLPLGARVSVVVASTKAELPQRLMRELPGSRTVELPPRRVRRYPEAHAEQLLERSRDSSVLVVAVHRDDHRPFLESLRERRPKQLQVVLVSLGSPYLLSAFPDVEAYVCAYAHRAPSVDAVADVLLGAREPAGRLPVTLDPGYPSGHGLTFHGGLPRPSLLVTHQREVRKRVAP